MYWLRARVHPTWQLTALCLGFVAGVALTLVVKAEPLTTYSVGGLCGILAVWKSRRGLVAVALIGGVLLGVGRGTAAQGDLAIYQPLVHRHVVVQAVIADDTDAVGHGATKLRLRNITLTGRELPGQVFATVTNAGRAKRSDTVIIDGVFDAGFGSFAATMTGKVTKIDRPVPGDIALQVRDGFASEVKKSIKEPEASLGIGYLLGQKNSLPNDLVDALKVTGLTHIVVASGYNLTILVRIGRRLFARVSKYLAALTSLSLVIGFIAMTGMSPSMTRAGLVATLSLWAWYFGRKFHPLTLLGMAMAVTVLVNPSYVWGDLGWLLSFAAFAGVMLLAPIMGAYFFGKEKMPLVSQILIETIAAQIATLPIMIMAFHQFSVIAPLANLLILPFIPLAMMLVAIAGVGTWVWPSITHVAGWPAEQLLTIQTAIIRWCADIPWAQSKPEWVWWGVGLYIAAVIAWGWYMKWRSNYQLHGASIIE